MTDIQMLEMAARAGGYRISHWDADESGVLVAVLYDATWWQPLLKNSKTDCMGDALRLAAKLGLGVDINVRGGLTRILHESYDGFFCTQMHSDTDEDAEFTATCIAIVRAAAALAEREGGDE